MKMVFISYAKEDLPEAQRIYDSLKSRGLWPWLDVCDLVPGQNWRHAIEDAISRSAHALVLLSNNTNSWYTVNQKGEEENGKAIQCGVQIGSHLVD